MVTDLVELLILHLEPLDLEALLIQLKTRNMMLSSIDSLLHGPFGDYFEHIVETLQGNGLSVDSVLLVQVLELLEQPEGHLVVEVVLEDFVHEEKVL